ncbi:MAG: phospho-sugar mutase, partial [Duncaniella sp.]|nr:phospho-sugar mutase [Duncaniella sp.]
SPVEVITHYLTLNATKADGSIDKLDFPTTSNVLQYFTADGSKVSVRPSGTEPKIKFYMEVRVPMAKAEDYNACSAAAHAKVDAIKKDLGI